MIPYPSIESVWKREGKHLVPGQVRQSEHALIRDWLVTEKIDGMNIRLIFSEAGLDIRGRTDNAQFKQAWLDFLRSLVDVERAKEVLRHPSRPDWNVTVYGELFGPGIQKGGTCADGLQFRAFDILYGGTVWANYEAVRRTAASLGLNTVPLVGTLWSIADIPTTAESLDRFLGASRACPKQPRMEGFVARPQETLLNGRGERIVFKLTYRDVPEKGAA